MSDAPEANVDWRFIATFCEVKNRATPMNENLSYLEVAGKSSCLLYAQDGCHAAPAIHILGSSIYLTIFYCSGSLSTCGFDIHDCLEQFLRILVGLSYERPSDPHYPSSLGVDTTLHWCRLQKGDGKHWVKQLDITLHNGTSGQASKRTIHLIKIIFISDRLLGQGTMVWEAEMFDGYQSVFMVLKDLWINLLQKYTEGMILHLLNEKGIQGVPSLVYEGQVRTPLVAGREILANTYFIRSLLLRNPTSLPCDYHLHVLYRLITRPIGILITEFHSLRELLVAFLDYIVAHKDAREMDAREIARILHRDISLVNLLLAWRMKGRSCHKTWMTNLSLDQRNLLKERINELQWCGVLADWGYVVLLPATADEVGPDMPLTSVLSQNASSENQVLVTNRESAGAVPVPTPISQLTWEDEIVVLSAKEWDKDKCNTIDLNPLHRTGIWSWMSAKLVMAGPKQPIVHNSLHDLESFFYILVGLCVLFEQPGKVKSDEALAKCFDRLFNTFEPSVLKTIMIQSNLTWHPSVLNHISPYFHPIIPLLEDLQREIVVPMHMDVEGRFRHEGTFNHATLIQCIIMTLCNLPSDTWVPYELGKDSQTNQAKQCQLEVGVDTKINDSNQVKSPPDGELSNDEAHPEEMPAVHRFWFSERPGYRYDPAA
ncbi:hypothetical protein OG21DRAFT_1490051 [Imleria badia]|nr:hypothetical protein OG21DRAFT_1490051 [Imleria badia]